MTNETVLDYPTDTLEAVLRQERIDLLASFYGTGVSSLAHAYAELFRDGIFVGRNRYRLQRRAFGVVEVGSPKRAPVLLKERWQDRMDVTVKMTREVRRAYRVPVIGVARGSFVGGGSTDPLTSVGLSGPVPPGRPLPDYSLPVKSGYGPVLAGQDLLVFLQEWVAGITNLPGELVSVSYQGEPVNVPAGDVPAWCALSISTSDSDMFPYVGAAIGL